MKESKKQATEVAKVNGNFNLVADSTAMQQMISEDLVDLNIGLQRVKLPTGGATSFEIESGDGEPETVKELRGVIVFNHPSYCYYKDAFNGENRMPDCYSINGQIGNGVPGGNCKTCPLNKFESGANGISKACKNKRALYIVLDGEVFPVTLLLPTGSLMSFTKYVQANMFKKRKLAHVLTKITLKKATNKTGIAFSQAVFTFERLLTEQEINQLSGVVDFVKEYALNHVPQNDVADDDIPFVDTETGEVIKPLGK